MNKTQHKAFISVKGGKATKAELKILLAWAKSELIQWAKFIKELEKKLNETSKKKTNRQVR
jgi:hypothetical protein